MATFCDGIVQEIERTECIGNSLVKINSNFSGLETAGCDLESRVAQIEEVIGGSSPTLIGIRLSYSATTATPLMDIKNATTLYVHPYKGNIIPLFNPVENKWFSYKILAPLSFSLATLAADTNYEIFLFEDAGTIKAEFVAWSSSVAGGTLPIREYQDTVAVKPSEPHKRLVGCLRTVAAGQSEQSFGDNIAGGSSPKQYLWNAQNIIPVTCYSFEVGSYNAVGIAPDGWTGWRRVNPTATNQGRNNRFSFINGDITLVNMTSQVYASYYANLTQLVTYTALGINNETAPTLGQGFMIVSELRGSDMTPQAQLIKSFTTGYNYLQMFENILTGIGVTAEMNENHTNQTGFLVSLFN
jgi:hypothetical protein